MFFKSRTCIYVTILLIDVKSIPAIRSLVNVSALDDKGDGGAGEKKLA